MEGFAKVRGFVGIRKDGAAPAVRRGQPLRWEGSLGICWVLTWQAVEKGEEWKKHDPRGSCVTSLFLFFFFSQFIYFYLNFRFKGEAPTLFFGV